MTIHSIKLNSIYFPDVKSGKKNYEIRKNDRDYKVGDRLMLHNYVPKGVMKRDPFSESDEEVMCYYIQTIPNTGVIHHAEPNGLTDRIQAVITAVIQPEHDVLETLKGDDDIARINMIEVQKTIKEYLGTDHLPDDYVILGIEV